MGQIVKFVELVHDCILSKQQRNEMNRRYCDAIWSGSNPQFLEHFSVNFARSAKIDNSSVQSGEQSDFSHKIIKSNVYCLTTK